MIFTRTEIEGALLVDPTPAEDERGCFFVLTSWNGSVGRNLG